MKIRIYTHDTFLDVEAKEEFSKEVLLKALDDGNTLAIPLISGSTLILPPYNYVALEILDTPHQS